MATFVICPGAWAGGWAWKKIRPLLRAAGHEVFTPTYSGLGERADQVSASTDLDSHIQDIMSVLFYEDLNHVVLLGHSYGGMVASGVADRAPDRIARLIYIDAFVPRNRQSLFDFLPPALRAQREQSVAVGDGWLIQPPTPRRTRHLKTSLGRRLGADGNQQRPSRNRYRFGRTILEFRARTFTAPASRPMIVSGNSRNAPRRKRAGSISRSTPAIAPTLQCPPCWQNS